MIYLHLSDNFCTHLQPSLKYTQFQFSGGEPHIKIDSERFLLSEDSITITIRLNTSYDLCLLLIATDALRRLNFKNISLYVPYFPGARQDKVNVLGEALTVKVYANIINSQFYNNVIVFDPHSDVVPALLNNCVVLTNHKFVQSCIKTLNLSDYWLVSPDAGSMKKIYPLAKFLNCSKIVKCSKFRNIMTGKLSHFDVDLNDLQGQPCVLVDDICDGGRTFIGLGEILKKRNCGPLYLIISHGIFNKGTDTLKSIYTGIFTTNSIRDETLGVFTKISSPLG